MTKLVMVIPSLKKGGAERIFSFIANNLNRKKFKIYLIIFDGKDIQFDIDKNGITLINLRKTSIIKGAGSLINQLKKIKPDVVFSTVTHLNILMSILSIFLRKNKFIARESSVISINNKYQTFPRVFNALIKLFYKRLDIIICQSNDMANDLIKNFNIPRKKIIIINNPITSDAKTVISKKSTLINFLSVGRLVFTKGFDRLIDIVSMFDFDFKYFIAGGGVEYLNLKNKVHKMKLQEKVIFLGEVHSLDTLYEVTDFYLHGSYYEGFPNTLLEAASHGIPIISFNTPGGINEIIVEGFNGLIVDNEKEYYEAIINALGYNWDRNLIQNDIYKRYNKNKVLLQYEDVLSNY